MAYSVDGTRYVILMWDYQRRQ
ncbi:hypothetical protein CCACVL1_18168 [Corchorus capsularis]|uniref:Uncharacterized protein n=1 Tax=Corchorus capsularis TaxID=210143 RepID=A0A1R3HM86_COCAP|nr:hypothetical protein CCACVL1_18168 [Corchorus capsularis]